MLECKTVTLRTRPLKHGMLSFYLDYYPGLLVNIQGTFENPLSQSANQDQYQ